MTLSTVALGVALLAAGCSAKETVWSSVAYLMYGERTPLHGSPSYPALTPLGAQQMFAQGSMFQARYLQNSTTRGGITGYAGIAGIEDHALDNTQLAILSMNDEHISAGALAFMQGLYPPRNQTFAVDNGGMGSAVLANRSVIDFPLSGYQYPRVQTMSMLDPSSTWIEGQVGCPRYQAVATNFKNDANVMNIYSKTLSFYQTLWYSVFQGAFSYSMASFHYALDLYEYALFEYNHNPQVRNTLNGSEIAVLHTLAGLQQRDINGNLTVSGKYQGDMVGAIAGRMLAAKVVSQLKDNIQSSGSADKLTLMFGSHHAFVSFFALANLIDGASSADFEGLPGPGAAMIFELFTTTHQNDSIYPSNDEFWVRFLYRQGVDDTDTLKAYPLFGNGNQQTAIKLNDFVNSMEMFSLDSVAGWCDICDSVNLFCGALESNTYGSSSGSGSSSSRGGLSPAVAGVVGAIVTLAIMALAAAAAVVLGRLRLYRADKQRNSSLGGFKGAEKMKSDPDLVAAKGGGRHERTGSWELRGGKDTSRVGGDGVSPPSSAGAGAAVRKDQTTMGFKNLDDDAVSDMGTPVSPRESV